MTVPPIVQASQLARMAEANSNLREMHVVVQVDSVEAMCRAASKGYGAQNMVLLLTTDVADGDVGILCDAVANMVKQSLNVGISVPSHVEIRLVDACLKNGITSFALKSREPAVLDALTAHAALLPAGQHCFKQLNLSLFSTTGDLEPLRVMLCDERIMELCVRLKGATTNHIAAAIGAPDSRLRSLFMFGTSKTLCLVLKRMFEQNNALTKLEKLSIVICNKEEVSVESAEELAHAVITLFNQPSHGLQELSINVNDRVKDVEAPLRGFERTLTDAVASDPTHRLKNIALYMPPRLA